MSDSSFIQTAAPNLDEAERTLIFVHIAKTAGTTLKRILEKIYRRDSIVTVTRDLESKDINNILVDDFKRLSPQEKRKIRFIRGHLPFGLHQYINNPYDYITMLRHPVERAVSWYYFYCKILTATNIKRQLS